MATTTGTSGAPTPDPGPREALEDGWGTFKKHFWVLLGAYVLASIINSVGSGLQFGLPMAGAPAWLGLVAGYAWILVVGVPVGAGLQYTYLRAARGESPAIGDIFSGFPMFVSLVGAGLLVGVATVVGLVLLIIPGIYVGLRLAFVPLLIVDRDLGAMEAIRRCWDTMGGNVLDLFLFGLASGVILFVGALLLLVGVFPALVWVLSSYAAFYRSLFDAEGAGPGGPGGTAAEPERVPETGGAGAS